MSSYLESPHGEVRFRAALRWLSAQERSGPLLVVAHSLDAARELMRAATLRLEATFGWELESLASLSSKLAALPLAERGLTVATPLALEAVGVRVVAELRSRGALGRFAHVGERPGLPPALLRTFTELALARVAGDRLARECPELAAGFELYRRRLGELGLADRADVLSDAIATVRRRAKAGELPRVCLYDIVAPSKLEQELVDALLSGAQRSFVTQATGDGPSDAAAEPRSTEETSALQRLQAQLFTPREARGSDDGSVSIFSAPGEARECVELARRILDEAGQGVPFDAMAILLRSPFHYRTHLVEALRRASIPAHFTRGAVRPEPAGRALIILLRCAAEGLSAVRFAEYLSLGVAPGRTKETRTEKPGVIADEAVAAALGRSAVEEQREVEAPEATPGGPSPFPRRWEALLVDAAVVGGAERWRRRLAGLEQQLSQEALDAERGASALSRLEQLRALSAFALPLIDRLDALPRSAPWGQWLEVLRELAERAVDRPEPVLAVLDELEIVREVGPLSLSEVRAVLEERLGELQVPPTAARGGQVLVASVDEARGRVFDVVFVPGLAEKLFPQRVVEDPLLSDRARAKLSDALDTQAQRVHRERQSLRVAVGCARRRVVLSYPRFESDKARPRVPSFYALEALRAAEGILPGFAALARRADAASATRMGWPAPDRPEAAIDASEFDLATLRVLLGGKKPELLEGAARYLVTEHRTLGRALQARARRWRPEWRSVDGLVDPSPEAREVLAARYAELQRRGFSATALEKFSSCPYRFYLSTVIGLRPKETIEQVEELDAATRGTLFHEIVHRVATELTRQRWLTLDDAKQAEALSDRVLSDVTASWRDKLAPAIGRVWEDAVEDLRLDVRSWLQELLRSDWKPLELELGFGLEPGPGGEPPRAVVLDCGLALRGRIDSVEERQGELRATDYKTGEAPPPQPAIIAGGAQLQPALYALVLEKLYPERRVGGGNAYYCTTRGGFVRRAVTLDENTRRAIEEFHAAVDRAFRDAFFPAAPHDGACERCDYRVTCGPYEAERVAAKRPERLEGLVKLRSIR